MNLTGSTELNSISGIDGPLGAFTGTDPRSQRVTGLRSTRYAVGMIHRSLCGNQQVRNAQSTRRIGNHASQRPPQLCSHLGQTSEMTKAHKRASECSLRCDNPSSGDRFTLPYIWCMNTISRTLALLKPTDLFPAWKWIDMMQECGEIGD